MPIRPGTVFEPQLISEALDKVPIAVTIFDLQGTMLYYNEHSTRVISRKPEHLGRDIRLCHQKPESNRRIDRMIEEFKQGRREPISYEANPYGTRLLISVVPLEVEGRLAAFLHTATPKP